MGLKFSYEWEKVVYVIVYVDYMWENNNKCVN